MPKANKRANSIGTNSNTVNTPAEEMLTADAIIFRLTELLNDETILSKLRRALHPQVLADKIDHLAATVNQLSQQLEKKEERIKQLEEKVASLEVNADETEQYSRRPNLRFQGLPETEGEDTSTKIIMLVNEKMRLDPPPMASDLERSHRLGPRLDRQGRPRVRPIIVRFTKERTRAFVYKSRFRLKDHNVQRPLERVFVNEDLTAARAALASKTRQLKKAGKILDTWTVNGKVMVKNRRNEIAPIKSSADLIPFQ